ncbi:FHA domain-containing protein [Roseateles chitinivorans]|uniref:FHA domain-containing protein n=1 Tax=Roseateles chitinivorans TaxID=2917965 RepID=UPI003D67E5BC
MDHAAVIEIVDRDGHCRESHKVRAWPLRIGRSPDCDLVLSDPHLAGAHALLHWERGEPAAGRVDETGDDQAAPAPVSGGPVLELLPSQNGGWLDGRRLAAGSRAPWPSSTLLQIGTTRLRLRTALDPLPAEKPMNRADEPVKRDARPAWALPALLALWALMLWGANWAANDGSASWVDTVSALLAPIGVALIWSALWALVTQLFRHWFAFGAHLWRALVATVAMQLLDLLLPLVAYMVNAPRLLALEPVLMSVGAALLLWWHATVVWPRASRRVAVGIGAMCVVGLVLTVGRRTEQQYWLGPNYMATLAPPSLRLVSPKPVDSFIDGMDQLEAPLLKQAEKRNEQAGGSGDNEE